MGSRRTYLRYIVALGLLVLLAAAIGTGLLYRMFTADLPNIATLQDYRPRIVTEVFSEEGDVIGEFFIEKRELVPMARIPKVLHDAMIASRRTLGTLSIETSSLFSMKNSPIRSPSSLKTLLTMRGR